MAYQQRGNGDSPSRGGFRPRSNSSTHNNGVRRPGRSQHFSATTPRRRGGGGRGKATINPSRFINAAAEFEQVEYAAKNKFSDFALCPVLQSNIADKGYVTPSAIQDQTIEPILAGNDIIGLANTGTGKTAAFLLPLIELQRNVKQYPSVLIITPTRELAQQIKDEFFAFQTGMHQYSAVIVGGMSIDRQIRDVRRRPHFIIGTPGRIQDLIRRRELDLSHIQHLVLDEADRMLDMGFLPPIREIVTELPTDRQTLFFSATMTPEIDRLTKEFLKDPITVSVRTSETSDHVEQDVVRFETKDHKIEILGQMLSKDDYKKVLIFGETKFGVQRLADKLNDMGVKAEAIHGNKSQGQRKRALQAFKDHHFQVLVATDVAARGLDIPNVTHVINFDTPQTYEDYIHRIGRTGRAGAHGHAHTFIQK